QLATLLSAPDLDQLVNWLRQQPVLQIDEDLNLIMVHAGLSPQWDLESAKKCAHDVEAMLRSDCYPLFLNAMYGDLPNIWSDKLQGLPRLRYVTNALTRIRYCYSNGGLDLLCKESPAAAPVWLKPWFNLSSPIAAQYRIAFGHWASLQGKNTPAGIYALDTGCCWGSFLTLLRWEDQRYFRQKALKK
ncbi:MAG: bis(5'-nucleosyl)-tetraphosphatase (symmetrical) ApaH, partial [Enterobacteriaceae bacterium]